MKIVTAGADYLDIDAYAGCAAYAKLLQLQGRDAKAASTASLNMSIPKSLRALEVDFASLYEASSTDEFILIDISDPDHFDAFVDTERVVEIIDHHMPHVDLWREKIGQAAQIEPIGAASTLVFERWKEAGMLSRMDASTATLLAAAILDNTLNFQAKITNQRDHAAFEKLSEIASLEAGWAKEYFTECQEHILKNIQKALHEDTKKLRYEAPLGDFAFGQLALWDAGDVLSSEKAAIDDVLLELCPRWMINIIDISQGVSFVAANDEDLLSLASSRLSGELLEGNIFKTQHVWLRKEIRMEFSS